MRLRRCHGKTPSDGGRPRGLSVFTGKKDPTVQIGFFIRFFMDGHGFACKTPVQDTPRDKYTKLLSFKQVHNVIAPFMSFVWASCRMNPGFESESISLERNKASKTQHRE